MLDQEMEPISEFMTVAADILRRSQPAVLQQAMALQPAKFKLTPRKIRPVTTAFFAD